MLFGAERMQVQILEDITFSNSVHLYPVVKFLLLTPSPVYLHSFSLWIIMETFYFSLFTAKIAYEICPSIAMPWPWCIWSCHHSLGFRGPAPPSSKDKGINLNILVMELHWAMEVVRWRSLSIHVTNQHGNTRERYKMVKERREKIKKRSGSRHCWHHCHEEREWSNPGWLVLPLIHALPCRLACWEWWAVPQPMAMTLLREGSQYQVRNRRELRLKYNGDEQRSEGSESDWAIYGVWWSKLRNTSEYEHWVFQCLGLSAPSNSMQFGVKKRQRDIENSSDLIRFTSWSASYNC